MDEDHHCLLYIQSKQLQILSKLASDSFVPSYDIILPDRKASIIFSSPVQMIQGIAIVELTYLLRMTKYISLFFSLPSMCLSVMMFLPRFEKYIYCFGKKSIFGFVFKRYLNPGFQERHVPFCLPSIHSCGYYFFKAFKNPRPSFFRSRPVFLPEVYCDQTEGQLPVWLPTLRIR